MKDAKVIWLTGPYKSGKSTLAKALAENFERVQILDGGDLRHTAFADKTGYSPDERREHMLRVGYVARLLVEHGITVICALESPFRSEREMIRGEFKPEQFIEISLKADPAVLRSRDTAGLYARADQDDMFEHFVDVAISHEASERAEMTLRTDELSLETCVAEVLLAVPGVRFPLAAGGSHI